MNINRVHGGALSEKRSRGDAGMFPANVENPRRTRVVYDGVWFGFHRGDELREAPRDVFLELFKVLGRGVGRWMAFLEAVVEGDEREWKSGGSPGDGTADDVVVSGGSGEECDGDVFGD